MNNEFVKTIELSKIELVKILSDILGDFAKQQVNLQSIATRKAICDKFYDAVSQSESSRDAG